MEIFRSKPKEGKPQKPLMVDIRHPSHRPIRQARNSFFSPTGWRVKEEKLRLKPRYNWVRWLVSLLIILSLASLLGYGGYLWTHRDEVAASIAGIYDGFRALKTQVLGLQTSETSDSLKKIRADLDNLRSLTTVLKGAPVLKEIPATFSQVNLMISKISTLNSLIAEAKSKGPRLLFKGNNGRLLEMLREAKKNVDDIKTITEDLRDRVSRLNVEILLRESGTGYLAFNSEMDRISEGLGALIAILSKPGEIHFAVALENPSEVRPAGGFSGSYADIVFEGGEIAAINVNDIYYPVHFSKTKIIPPFQLQTITTRWTVQDANWFFDFPTSGRKFLEFLEDSSIYKDKNIKFEGDIAINVRLIEDILKIIGPIELPQYKLTLTHSNFLREVQEEVEQGVDKKPGQNPKKILSVITPILMDRIKNIPDDKKEAMLDVLVRRFQNKDIKLYFKNKELESLVAQYGGAGDVFDIPGGWNGDYLAVVNANVAGGKSDAYVSQEIKLISKIMPTGKVENILNVTRAHKGQNQPEKWYRATNQNFIKIFTLPKARLLEASGGGTKTIRPSINYQKNGYASDPDLAAVEGTADYLSDFNFSTYSENNKSVFATWMSVPAGKSKTLELNYSNPRELVLSSGLKYTFVLDKQSGVESHFKYSIEAPEGYIWRESKSSIFSYENSALPARLIIPLTLQETN